VFTRVLIPSLLLAALGWQLHQLAMQSRFRGIDEGFEDFLIANSRARFDVTRVEDDGQVVVVAIPRELASEFDSWPPSPLEWHMILESVAAWEPELVVITEPLNWGDPPPDFVPALAKKIRSLPAVVLAVDAVLDPPGTPPQPAFWGGAGHRFPRYRRVAAMDAASLPSLKSLVVAPDPQLLPQSELGLPAPSSPEGLPAAVLSADSDAGNVLIPTLPSQALSRALRSPYSFQRLRFGPGAGIHFDDGRFVPLSPDGWLPDAPQLRPLTVSALDLMAGPHLPLLDANTAAAAKRARVVVAGIAREDDDSLHQLARTLAGALALPVVQKLAPLWERVVWAAAGLVALALLVRGARGRSGGLTRAVLALFLGLTASWLAFESTLTWCPPTLPAVIVMGAGLLSSLFRKRPPAPPKP
jgi:hypothetical protein